MVAVAARLFGALGAGLTGGAIWLRTYPRFPNPAGPHRVASLKYRFPGSVQAQIFYPVCHPAAARAARLASAASAQPSLYMRAGQIDGLSRWLRKPKALLSYLLDGRAHPLVGMPDDSDAGSSGGGTDSRADGKGTLPIFVFSHGLGGSCELYTALCSALASSGIIVVAVEHEDGSGSYAERVLSPAATGESGHAADSIAEPVWFRRPPPDLDYTVRQNVVDFREPFLRQRVRDLESVFEFRRRAVAQAGERAVACGDDERSVAAAVAALLGDPASAVIAGGHSFGAATALLASERLRDPSTRIAGCVLHDLWPYCVPEASLRSGAPTDTPTLLLLSEQFARNDEAYLSQRYAKSSRGLMLPFSLDGTRHQAFSDAVWWFPDTLSKLLRVRGAADSVQAHTSIVLATTRFVHACSARTGQCDANQLATDISTLPLMRGFPAATSNASSTAAKL